MGKIGAVACQSPAAQRIKPKPRKRNRRRKDEPVAAMNEHLPQGETQEAFEPDRSSMTAGAATPMMAQYMEIKAANPDSLLFYRMGDFYELFFGDAETASRALGITLTRRGKHQGEDIPMCGVPVHAADDYLQKLIGRGYRVAVCEQLEDPAEARKRGAKAVVRRDVTRLVTPATVTEEKLLDPGETSYLLAIARTRASGEIALAFIDITTGDFRVAPSAPDRLAADITRIAPREIIVPEPVFADPELRTVLDPFGLAVTPLPQPVFDSATAGERIARYFGVGTTDGFGDFSRAELAAAAGAIAYVEKTQIAERPALQRPQRDNAARSLFIDAATRANLELERTLSGSREGSLLKAMDRTVTGGGARLLAARLRAPLTDPEDIARRLDSVSFLLAEDRLRESLQDALKRFPDMPRALSRLSLNRGGPRDLAALKSGLEGAGTIGALLAGLDLPAELAGARTALDRRPGDLADLLSASLAEELPLFARDGGFIARGAHGELDELRALRDESRRVIAEMQGRYADETGVRSLKIRYNNVLGYFIEVTQQNADALAGTDEGRQRFIHRQTLANAMRFTTVELSDMESRIANAAGRAVAIELELFEAMRSACVAAADALRALADAASVLDVSAGLAELAGSEGYCRPLVTDTNAFRIVAGRHPVVEQALRRQAAQPFVANDCDLSAPGGTMHGALWLLTGPNMGGKSTFLRQNALIAVMAQAGSFVPAGSAEIGVVDRLFSRVGASDDLARGRSTFMVEMVETAAILNQATERSLVILDEIGRGTATFDGLSIAWAAIEYLHEKNRCRTLFATHFHELTALTEKLPRLANVTMRVKEWNGEVIFLHEVTHGAADRSYGVQVARLAGLPDAVVARARDVLARLEEQGRSERAPIIDDLPLFSAEVKRAPKALPADPADAEIRAALDKLMPDEMTPLAALEALYSLKALAGKKD